MPPLVEPVQLQIAEAVQARLQTIDGGATYFYDIQDSNVRLTDLAPPDFSSYPAIAVSVARTGYDNPRAKVVRSVAGSMDIQLTCMLATASNVARSIARFVHDVHTALYEDIQFGGLTVNCRVTGDEWLYPTSAEEPLCGVDVFVTIDYRAARADLTTTAT